MNLYDLTQIMYYWVSTEDGYAEVKSNANNKKIERKLIESFLSVFGNYKIVEERKYHKQSHGYITDLPFGLYKKLDKKIQLILKKNENQDYRHSI